jgi:hypothetical protein
MQKVWEHVRTRLVKDELGQTIGIAIDGSDDLENWIEVDYVDVRPSPDDDEGSPI